MPIPVLAAGGLGAIISAALRYFFMARLASAVVRTMTVLGIGWATNEYVIQPFIDRATLAWNAMPDGLRVWIGALGIDFVVSCLITAYGIAGVKELFLAKRE